MSKQDLKRIEVLTEVLAGRRTTESAAAVLNLSVRQAQRLLARYQDGGGAALIHRSRGRTASNRLSHGEGGAYALAVDDDGGFSGCASWDWLCVRVFGDRFDLAKVATLHGSGPLLPGIPPSVLDLNQLGAACKFTVDVHGDLGLIAGSVKALIRNHVSKKCGVVSAATGAGDTGPGGGVEGRVFAVERSIRKREIKVRLYPCGQVLCGEQVGLLLLPVLAPALLVGFGLRLLRQTGDEVGVTGGDALLDERLGNCGDELQKRETGVDVACALARLLDQCGNVVAGEIEQALEALRLLVRVNVDPLRVLDLSSVLQKVSTTYTTMDTRALWNLYL